MRDVRVLLAPLRQVLPYEALVGMLGSAGGAAARLERDLQEWAERVGPAVARRSLFVVKDLP